MSKVSNHSCPNECPGAFDMVNPNRDRPQGTWGDGILSYSVRGSRHLGFRSKDADPNQRSDEIRGLDLIV